MPNSKIFCNIPWYELNINMDGSFDLCGCQNDKIMGTPLGDVWNIKRMTIDEYWHSTRMKKSRLQKLSNEPDPMCRMCQAKDEIGYESNRKKEIMKSAIFLESFERSYQQSPNYKQFKYSEEHQGETLTFPHSLHLNMGFTCNFACRMCNPWASSRLQTEFKQLGWVDHKKKYSHWSEDTTGWSNFTNYLEKNGDKLKVIHIIGGEVGFIDKFDYVLDYFIDRELAHDVNFSFTINASIDYTKYFERLAKYKRVEIGISIESVDAMGDYIRQGGNITEILKNIEKLKQEKTNNMSFAIRTVPSLLSLPSYHKLVEWAWRMGIPIDNSLLVNPIWQQAYLLPDDMMQDIRNYMEELLVKIPSQNNTQMFNQKDANRIDQTIRNECESIINLTKKKRPDDADDLLKICASKLDQWDRLKKINLKNYSVKLYQLLEKYGYRGA